MKFHDFSPFYRSNEGIKPKVSGDRLLDNPLVADVQSGASFKFDGDQDYIVIGNDASLHPWSSGSATLEAWINPRDIVAAASIWSSIPSGYANGVALGFSDASAVSSPLKLWSYVSGPTGTTATSTGSVYTGQWTHVAVSYNGSDSVTFYINGVASGTSSWSGGDASSTDIAIGKWYGGAINPTLYEFDGEIRQIRLHNRALTAAEVRAAYNGQAVGFEYVGASQTELLTDGGLEAWTGDALDSWTEVETGSSTITNDQANERSGSNSAKFTLDSSGSVMMMKQNVSFVEGKRYRLSLWAKGATGSGEGFYIRTDATGGTYGGDTGTLGGGGATASWQQNTVNNSISGSWTEYVWEFVAASTDNAFVLLRSGDDSTSFYVDDLSVKRLGCVAEYLPSGISATKWINSSGTSGLDGTVTGATAVNHEVGSLTMVDNIVMASGKGIDFSATSDATGKTSEVLDDYEEGTWTPSIADIHETALGSYIRVGNQVTAWYQLSDVRDPSEVGGVDFLMTGMPFARSDIASGVTQTYFPVQSYGFDYSSGIGLYWAWNDTTELQLYEMVDGGASSAITDAAFPTSSGPNFLGVITYTV